MKSTWTPVTCFTIAKWAFGYYATFLRLCFFVLDDLPCGWISAFDDDHLNTLRLDLKRTCMANETMPCRDKGLMITILPIPMFFLLLSRRCRPPFDDTRRVGGVRFLALGFVLSSFIFAWGEWVAMPLTIMNFLFFFTRRVDVL